MYSYYIIRLGIYIIDYRVYTYINSAFIRTSGSLNKDALWEFYNTIHYSSKKKNPVI